MLNRRAYVQFAGEERRKRYGQYFTPAQVAGFMGGWVKGGDAERSGQGAVAPPC